MKKVKILYVEDEINIRQNHTFYIQNNFNALVYEASDGIEGLTLYKKYQPDIIITDLSMPNMCGLEMIEKIREYDEKIKIIVFSAHSDQEKLLRAIKLNLTDYKIKPLKRAALYEVVEQTIALFKEKQTIYFSKNCYFDPMRKLLFENEEPIKLTKNEILLLETLLAQSNTLLSPVKLFNAIWDYEKEYNLDSIRTLIKKLRRKLPPNTIENIYGGGYKLHTLS
jgi:DNA-binding response OmpR family regulator